MTTRVNSRGPQGVPGADSTPLIYGTSTLDFGAASQVASVTVTGQTGCLSTSQVRAWMQGDSTADNTAFEHIAVPLRVTASDVTTGGFVINGISDYLLGGTFVVRWAWSV